MCFDEGSVAVCGTGYSKHQHSMHADAVRVWFGLEPGYEYGGLKGKTSEGEMDFHPVNQQAAQMDDFAQCVRYDREKLVPAEMGLREMRIIQAMYKSARTG
ncbi:Gfo/Idh/MocA family oxidoreductase [Pollutibacter soli]|uniref:Gfo/Idh/MocA family oxidoreductase n=1 Tax=Pollutibacter soli TaxID=3034157 RepID=UPI003AF62A65